MSDSVQPHRQQPTRLPRPWDSPGRNTGVGCHFLLQCMKVKNESEVAQSCPTLSDPMDYSLPGSSVHGIFQARVLEWGAIAFSIQNFRLLQILITVLLYFVSYLFGKERAHIHLCIIIFLLKRNVGETKIKAWSQDYTATETQSLFTIHLLSSTVTTLAFEECSTKNKKISIKK